MEDIKQCWAFHRDGARCEHPAGHPGDHTTSTSWTDLECATPGEFEVVERSAPATLVRVPLVEHEEHDVSAKPEVVTKCVACGHKHKGGACRCGCYEFVG
jgi:hypothetical protein